MVLVPLHSLDQLFGTSYLTISEIHHFPLTLSIAILKLFCLLTTDWRRSSDLETLSASALNKMYYWLIDWLICLLIDWLLVSWSKHMHSLITSKNNEEPTTNKRWSRALYVSAGWVMLWPWPLPFWPQILKPSSLSQTYQSWKFGEIQSSNFQDTALTRPKSAFSM